MGENFDFKTCFIVVVDFEDIQRQLFLRTTSKHSRQLGSEQSKDNFVACLKWFSRLRGPQNQLAMIEIIDGQNNLTSKRKSVHPLGIVLYATPAFVRHYCLESASSDHGFRVKRMANVVPLVSATICVNNEVTYGHLSSKTNKQAESGIDWTTRLLLNACRGPVLCRRGDVVSLLDSPTDVEDINSSCVVLDCEPVDQGVLVPSTSLAIVQASSSVNRAIGNAVIAPGTRRKPNFLSCLTLLTYTIKLFEFSHHSSSQLNRVVRLLAIATTIMHSWRLKFRIRILARNPIRIGSRLCETLDPFQVVYVPLDILRHHALPDFSWALGSLSTNLPSGDGQDSTWKYKQRLVRLCSVDRSATDLNLDEFGHMPDEGVCHITPLLWFNLNVHPSTLVQPDATLVIKKYLGTRPPYARQIHVSLVQSPRNWVPVDCSRILSRYFHLPRLMCEGDVFCLQGDESSLTQLSQSLFDGILKSEPGLIYFRVSKIEGDKSVEDLGGYLVDRIHSSLYQEGISQTYVPNTMEDFWSSNSLHPIWDFPIPVGFHRCCSKLADTVVPYLKSASLRTATLVAICLVGPRGCGKMTAVNALIKQLNLQVVVVNCWELIGDSAGATAARIQTLLQKVATYAPCCVILKNVHLIGKDDSGIANGESRVMYAFKEALTQLSEVCVEYPVIVIGTTTDTSLLGSDLESLFLHVLEIEGCDADSRSDILSVLLSSVNVGLQVSLQSLVQKTSGYILGDLCALINRASIAAHRRIAKLTYNGDHLMSSKEEFDLCLAGPRILNCDFDDAFAAIQSALSDAIGAPKIPSVKWEDIGGLEDVKAEILDTVQLPLQHPELLATGMRRSGVLLYGPPGTGKTLLAKAVATECSLNFLSVKGPELINMYVGQSEENVRKIFKAARSAAPCIIFFDELDSLAPKRGRSGDSGGVMDRVVSQLLSEMDGLHCTNDVFVMGATNRPDLLDPALLRPGRLDKSLYVGICSDKSAQLKILTALTRKFHLTDDVNLGDIVDVCPANLTGADFYALCSEALLNAISREIQQLELGTREMDKHLSVTSHDFSLALKNLTPSVSDEELRHYATVIHKMKQ